MGIIVKPIAIVSVGGLTAGSGHSGWKGSLGKKGGQYPVHSCAGVQVPPLRGSLGLQGASGSKSMEGRTPPGQCGPSREEASGNGLLTALHGPRGSLETDILWLLRPQGLPPAPPRIAAGTSRSWSPRPSRAQVMGPRSPSAEMPSSACTAGLGVGLSPWTLADAEPGHNRREEEAPAERSGVPVRGRGGAACGAPGKLPESAPANQRAAPRAGRAPRRRPPAARGRCRAPPGPAEPQVSPARPGPTWEALPQRASLDRSTKGRGVKTVHHGPWTPGWAATSSLHGP